MLNLVRNENMKIYRRARTWVFFGLILFALLIQAAFTLRTVQGTEHRDWQQEITRETQIIEERLQNPELQMPPEQRREQELQVAVNRYHLDHEISPFAHNAWKFTKNSSAIVALITLFTIVVAGDIVAAEFGWGTIKLLLIRPASRTKILLAKYLAVLLFACLMLITLLGCSFLIGGALFGFAGGDQPYLSLHDTGITETTVAKNALLTFALEPVSLVMFATVAFVISAAFRSSSMAIGVSMLTMFLGQMIVGLLARFDWVQYLLFANLNLMQYFEGAPVVPTMTLPFSLGINLLYFVVLHGIGWLLFTKRDVAA